MANRLIVKNHAPVPDTATVFRVIADNFRREPTETPPARGYRYATSFLQQISAHL